MQNSKINIFLIHSYNGDTAESFAPSVKQLADKHNIPYTFPHFPIRKEASYESWASVMDQYLSQINEDTVMIAHSFGTLFVPRYIAENHLRIKAYISVAGYMHYSGRADLEEIMKNFYPSDTDFAACEELIPYRYSIYSDYDRMNDSSKLIAYAELLKAEQIMVHGAGHFGPQSGIMKIAQVDDILLDLIAL